MTDSIELGNISTDNLINNKLVCGEASLSDKILFEDTVTVKHELDATIISTTTCEVETIAADEKRFLKITGLKETGNIAYCTVELSVSGEPGCFVFEPKTGFKSDEIYKTVMRFPVLVDTLHATIKSN